MQNDVKVWDYAMSGDELEELRSDAKHFSITLTSLMWDSGLINETKKNEDLSNFRILKDKVWMEYSKEKSYDECFKILETKFNEILKKYDLELK